MSLPGTPIIYYGDEIGMGDNIYLGDRNGVRTPMQWSADRNAGFSTANPQQLYLPPIIDYEYHYETVNVENQTRNPSSLLNWMKRIISIRKRHPALANGSLEFLYPENPRVLAFLRRSAGETVLVVANLSRLAQFAELDLSAFRGCVPLELFGRSLFPRVGELPYLLTLTPYAFFWFALCPRQEAPLRVGDGDGRPGVVETEVPVLSVSGEWDDILRGPARRALEQALPRYLRERRWFAGKPRAVQSARIADAIHLRELKQPIEGYFVLVDVDYADAEPQTCLIPLGFGSEEQFETLGPHAAHRVVARMEVERNGFHQTGMLYDLVGDEDFSQALLEIIGSRRTFQGAEGAIHGRPSSAFRRLRGPADEPLKTTVLKGEQGGSQVVYGDRFLLKLFRRVEQGINPDVEIGMYLADQAGFPHTPPVAGTIEYRVPDHLPATLAVLQGYIPNQGTAWDYSLKSAAGYFERILADLSASPSPQDTAALPMLVELAGAEIPPAARQRIGPYLQSVELLGRRTAELHIALSAEAEDRAFAPEPFSKLYQRSLYQAARHQAVRSLELLARRLEVLPEEDRGEAQRLLGRREDLIRRLHRLVGREIVATRIRCHGDYRLGQVLFTGDDFVIMNFEGELAQPLSQRRIKTSPFRDVAGMLCSFDYACRAALEARIAGLVVPESDYAILEQWVRFWVGWTSAAFLRAYLEAAEGQAFVPRPRDAVQTLLDVYLMEKYLEELQYELNNRPDWAWIPLQGVWRILSQTE
jgi:maltose alpha-D-glucosyltransferase/alpha-amylase